MHYGRLPFPCLCKPFAHPQRRAARSGIARHLIISRSDASRCQHLQLRKPSAAAGRQVRRANAPPRRLSETPFHRPVFKRVIR